jgi:8-amino-7-oxononanoate synthase
MNATQHYNHFLQSKLDDLEANGLLRNLVIANNLIDFSSNDYLGFSKSANLNVIEKGLRHGATGSRSISGNCKEAEEAEEKVAAFHRHEAALIFNSGYAANVGLFSCIASRGDTFISDEYIHASIIDGMRLSYATRVKFLHNNIEDLEQRLQQAIGNKFVVVESIYSMDGDEAPLIAISALCKKYKALLIVDEAHALGVYGDKGDGLVCKHNLQKEVLACIYTFGKAAGLHGAAIAGNASLRKFLINKARSFIYSTAMPPGMYDQIKTAYDLLPTANREKLFERITYFKNQVHNLASLEFLKSNSPIQGIMLGDNLKAKAMAQHLMESGFFIKAILSPTVPVGMERLRICLHEFNSKQEIDELINQIKFFLR